MNVSAAIILYHPDAGLIQRIQSYLPHVNRLFVFDNTESVKNDIKAQLVQIQKIVYVADGENKGISSRLNQAAAFSIQEGFDWLLTMDQDSYFAGDNFPNFLRCLQEYSERDNVAVLGTQYTNPALQSSTCHTITTNHLITSGSILNLKLFPLIGPFDEALFIDQVDSEYCYRAILKEYRVVQFSNIFLQHSLGKQSIHRSLKSLKKTKRSLHSPLRLYYMTRNYFYVRSRYQKYFRNEIAELKGDLLVRIKNNFLYSSHRFSLIKNVLSGIIDYKRNRMGKKS